ncbi:MAG: hypothetical protein ABFS02_14300, partial [Pseudomonadota bacterium]
MNGRYLRAYTLERYAERAWMMTHDYKLVSLTVDHDFSVIQAEAPLRHLGVDLHRPQHAVAARLGCAAGQGHLARRGRLGR